MPENSWELLSSEVVRNYPVLRFREDKYRFAPTGEEADFAVCESSDWVLVIPITADDQVVFIRQYRHGLRQSVLEIPGGVMDPGEAPAETAARELQEETGFVPQHIELFGPLFPNPALNTARFHVAVASQCKPGKILNPDPFEQIEVELKPLNTVEEMIRSGQLQHALCIAAFAISGVHHRSRNTATRKQSE